MSIRSAVRSFVRSMPRTTRELGKLGLDTPARNARGSRQLSAAVGVTLEMLEERILFGNGIFRGAEVPPDIAACNNGATAVTADINAGVNACCTNASSAPVRYFDGLPEYTSTDLTSNGFGQSWGVTRSWTGLNESGQIGNGWMVEGLPYLVLSQNQYPGQHGGTVVLISSGKSQERFDIAEGVTGLNASDFTPRNTAQSRLVYVAPTTAGAQDVPGYFQLSDTTGNVTTFYDLPRDSTNFYGQNFGRIWGEAGYAQQVTNQHSSDYYRFGSFRSHQDANGNLTTAVYDAATGNLSYVERTDGSGKAERFVYTYSTVSNSLGGSVPLISQIALKRRNNPADPWATVRAAEYTYYTGDDDGSDYGRLGDLKRVTITDYQKDPNNPEIVDQKYYRYYKFSGISFSGNYYYPTNGYDTRGPANGVATTGGTDGTFTPQSGDNTVFSGLRTVLEGASYSRLSAAVSDTGDLSQIEATADTNITSYANNTYQYERYEEGDTLQYPSFATRYRVIKETAAGTGCSSCSGGFGTYKFVYDVIAPSPGNPTDGVLYANKWVGKTVEYLPDNTSGTWDDNDRNIVYTNEIGQVILKDQVDAHGTTSTTDDTHLITYNRYEDGNGGRLILTAHPSAVTGYSESYSDLVGKSGSTYQYLSANSGLIDLYTFSTSTTSGISDTTAGDVTGYLKDTFIQQGYLGTPIKQDEKTYYAHTAVSGGLAIHPVATDTVYRNADGTGAETTSHAYTWFSGTNQMQSQTITSPTITTSQNGPGSADVETNVYDAYNRLIWRKDAGGFITHLEYDNATGTLTKTITDVDTASGQSTQEVAPTWNSDDIGSPSNAGSGSYNAATGTWTIKGGGWDIFDDGSEQYHFTHQSLEGDGSIVAKLTSVQNTSNWAKGGLLWRNGTATGAPYATIVVTPGAGLMFGWRNSQSGTPSWVAVTGVTAPEWLKLVRSGDNISAYYGSDGVNWTQAGSTQTIDLADTAEVGLAATAHAGGTTQTSVFTSVAVTKGTVLEEAWDSDDIGSPSQAGSGSYNAVTGTWTIKGGGWDIFDDGSEQYHFTHQSLEGDGSIVAKLTSVQNTSNWAKGGLLWRNGTATGAPYATIVVTPGAGLMFGWRNSQNGTPDWVTVSGVTAPEWLKLVRSGDNISAYYGSDGVNWTQAGSTQTIDLADTAEVGLAATAHAGGTTQTSVFTSVAVTATGTTSNFPTLPTGWTTPTGGGLNLTTTNEVDGLGRTIKQTDPNGNITYTVYNDAEHESRTYRGWDAANHVPTGPTEVYREDWARGYTETLTMSATPSVDGNGVPTGAEAISGVQTLSRSILNDAGQVVARDDYFNLTGITYSASAVTLGTAGTNYYRTEYAYDERGRLSRTLDPTGTIMRIVYDGFDRPVSRWIGTDDTPTSGYWSPSNTAGTNLIQVSASEYDNGGVGDGNLTKSIQFVSDPNATGHDSSTDRITLMAYDWRNRLVATKAAAQASESAADNTHFITHRTLDNLGNATVVAGYDGDNVSITTDANSDGVPDAPATTLRRSYVMHLFDEQSREYDTETFSVDPTDGTTSAASLSSRLWRDHRGNVIKSEDPSGLVTKNAFDGANRLVGTFNTDGGGDSSWADAFNVTGDIVLQQSKLQLDANGNPIFSTNAARLPGASGTGALTGSTGRITYASSYYDAANRLTASVDVGTNGGSAYTRPSTVPTRSDSVLVTGYGYNAMGLVELVTDPKAIVNRSEYDNLGRTTKTIAAYTDGTPTDSTNQTTEYTYDGVGHLLTMKALLPNSAHQTTAYVYGVTITGGSGINSNDLLAATKYPDKTTGDASSSEQESYKVNALGERISTTDRNGSVHEYTRDVLGRLTLDAVTTLGTGVDGSVRALGYTYNTQGLPDKITSYSDAAATTVVNQVQRTYNGLGQLTGEYQAHAGSVNTSTTPKVQYAYGDIGDGSRLTSMTYPNGRVLHYVYATSLDDSIGRLSYIADDNGSGGIGTHLEEYAYLGLSILNRLHPESGVDLNVTLDDFGRVVTQDWNDGANSLDKYTYTYDRNSNRLTKANALNSSLDEAYTYDNLNRLSSATRNGSAYQSWDLDATGNWDSFTDQGTTDNRTHNLQNQVTQADGSALTFDANGNTTTDEAGRQYVYDAWDRMAKVIYSPTDSLNYRLDGLGRQVSSDGLYGWDVVAGPVMFYSNTQVIEEWHPAMLTGVSDEYVWSAAYSGDLVLRDHDTNASDPGLEERRYVLQDANHNVTALVDTSGVVSQRYVEDAYGNQTVLSSTWAAQADAYNLAYGHQGGRRDLGTGLYLFGGRYYSPTLGRWMQADAAGYIDGASRYQFVRSNPINHTDPSGMAVANTKGMLPLWLRQRQELQSRQWDWSNGQPHLLGGATAQPQNGRHIDISILIDKSTMPATFNAKRIEDKIREMLKQCACSSSGDSYKINVTPWSHIPSEDTLGMQWDMPGGSYNGSAWDYVPFVNLFSKSYRAIAKRPEAWTSWVTFLNTSFPLGVTKGGESQLSPQGLEQAAYAAGLTHINWDQLWANALAHEVLSQGVANRRDNGPDGDINSGSLVVDAPLNISSDWCKHFLKRLGLK